MRGKRRSLDEKDLKWNFSPLQKKKLACDRLSYVCRALSGLKYRRPQRQVSDVTNDACIPIVFVVCLRYTLGDFRNEDL